jgi:ParB family transcriptional regulator, chromosome partitioning protein
VPAKRFDFTPIAHPAAPARDLMLAASPDGSRPLTSARLVPVDRLVADPDQPRKTFDQDALDDLAASLRHAGMLQPITTYYDDSREQFVVISGERRLLAARIAGLTEVPVLVEHRPVSDGDKLILQLAENLVREGLTTPDAARALARLKELQPTDWLEVARKHGINRRRAYQYLEYLTDPEPLREALDRGAIADGHAQELRRVSPVVLTVLLDEVIANNLSVQDTRRLIAADTLAKPARARTASVENLDPPAVKLMPDRPPFSASHGIAAGTIADVIKPASSSSTAASTVPSPGAALRDEKLRRDRTRRLRARLERIASELRNMHVEEVAGELTALPEIIVQAREARDSLDQFINLLERVRMDRAGEMELP